MTLQCSPSYSLSILGVVINAVHSNSCNDRAPGSSVPGCKLGSQDPVLSVHYNNDHMLCVVFVYSWIQSRQTTVYTAP